MKNDFTTGCKSRVGDRLLCSQLHKAFKMVNLVATAALGCILAYCIDTLIKYRKTIAPVGHLPGIRLLFSPMQVISNLIPPTPFVSVGPGHIFSAKYTVFERLKTDIYVGIGLLPPTVEYFVSDPEALKQVFAARGDFGKHERDYRMITAFGKNLLSADGEEWRRQRKIVAPVFTEKNNQLVHTSAREFMDGVAVRWSKQNSIYIQDVNRDLTMPVMLYVIAKAGFGQDVKLEDDEEIPEGHILTFKQALWEVSRNLLLIMLLPKWALALKARWKYLDIAREELKSYLHEMISSSRTEKLHEGVSVKKRYDLFSQLLYAHDENNTLSEEELIGNTFLFVIAGHETTAHSLALTLGLMAIYLDEQRKLVNQILDLQKEGHECTYDNLPKYTYALAVWYETLRLYPIAPGLPRRARADTTLVCSSHHAQSPVLFDIKEGVRAFIDIPGLHYNPKYWDDPTEFIPSRFLDGSWNRDAFIPFLGGPRACIGRKFAETAAMTVLVNVLSRYEVTIDKTRFKLVPGESTLQLRERLLRVETKLTLTPQEIPLVFTPRNPRNTDH
ncbi:unnamed protein product [Rhizoctonia solani]|uniref:Cytochrome P450 n=1 Tax=Rhizoctonia solani TaxID=456999 RepID=A0A8H3C7F4_9AGAM|nr:unnamed protein product [Rhizoctonia solani]